MRRFYRLGIPFSMSPRVSAFHAAARVVLPLMRPYCWLAAADMPFIGRLSASRPNLVGRQLRLPFLLAGRA